MAALLAPAPARAQTDDPPSPLTLAGQPVRALAFHPDISIGFRSVVRGRQSSVARHLRSQTGGGQLQVAENRYVFGWACDGGACARDGLFLGHDTEDGRFYVLLIEEGDPTLTVPTRRSPWPPVLVEQVAAIRPDLRRRIE